MRSDFQSNIAGIRAVEDAIRATHKYTEGIGTLIGRAINEKQFPEQGEGFTSKAFSRCYEIYPDMVVSLDMLDMPASVAIDWLWADTTCINARFWYDYRNDKASFKVVGGDESLRRLLQCIPGLLKLLLVIVAGTEEEKSLIDLSKTAGWIPKPMDAEDAAEPEQKPLQRLLDKLLPERKRTG